MVSYLVHCKTIILPHPKSVHPSSWMRMRDQILYSLGNHLHSAQEVLIDKSTHVKFDATLHTG